MIKLLGKYELHEQIGRGGFGTVYRATDTSLGREVAVKVLHPQLTTEPDFLERFRNEARLIASLSNPNIVTIYELEEIDGRIFIAMQYLPGGSLKDRLEQSGAMSLEQSVEILRQVCSGLQAAHRKGLLHRDIKPANILLDEDGRAVISDFGLARAVQLSGSTSSGGIGAGTPAYRAPELWLGKPPATPATDIYSLGCVLSEMLTGKPLFDGETTDVVITQHLVLGATIPQALPAGVKNLLAKALEKNPEDRYANVQLFEKEIASVGRRSEAGEINILPEPELGTNRQVEVREKTESKKNETPEKLQDLSTKSHDNTTLTLEPVPELDSQVKDKTVYDDSEKTNKPNSKTKRTILQTILVLIIVGGLVWGAITMNNASQNKVTGLTATQTSSNTQIEQSTRLKVCEVTDTGGIDDKSFNATAWKGAQDAMTQLDIEAKYLESKEVADFEKNINAFIAEDCDIIITVGFLLGDATAAAAAANPEVKFSIVDYGYSPVIPNVVGQAFQTDEAAFLAGYLSAGVTKTGIVGTFGGMNIPTITIIMDGFARGVSYFNQVHDTSVTTLGWDVTAKEGLFTNDFSDQQKGNYMAITLMDEGADIIVPVAGPVGLGAAAAVKERGNAYIIGVESDWFLTAPDYANVTLTSIMKRMDVTTFEVIKSAKEGTFVGGSVVGNLANGGVALAPFHNLEGMVPTELVTELEYVKDKILTGEITMNPDYQLNSTINKISSIGSESSTTSSQQCINNNENIEFGENILSNQFWGDIEQTRDKKLTTVLINKSNWPSDTYSLDFQIPQNFEDCCYYRIGSCMVSESNPSRLNCDATLGGSSMCHNQYCSFTVSFKSSTCGVLYSFPLTIDLYN